LKDFQTEFFFWNIEKLWNNAKWLSPIKEPEKNNMYGWQPTPSDLPDNVQHLPSFPLCIFLMPIPLQPLSSHYRILKNPSL
jgi:hypothetical protein